MTLIKGQAHAQTHLGLNPKGKKIYNLIPSLALTRPPVIMPLLPLLPPPSAGLLDSALVSAPLPERPVPGCIILVDTNRKGKKGGSSLFIISHQPQLQLQV